VRKYFRRKEKSEMLLEHVNGTNSGETSLDTVAIAMYELGDLAKYLFYRRVYPDEDRTKYYSIEAKIAMSDLLAQCLVICEREGWIFDDLKGLGVARCIERIERRIKHGE
jgi:hypothetical protein